MFHANDDSKAEKRDRALQRLRSRHRKLLRRGSSSTPLLETLIATLEKKQKDGSNEAHDESNREYTNDDQGQDLQDLTHRAPTA